VLGGEEVSHLLTSLQLMEPVAAALEAYSAGSAQSPPRVATSGWGGWLGAMPAYLPERALAAKLISVFPANALERKPSHQGMVALFDHLDGRPLCVMDARHITSARTAIVSAISVRELARPGARVLAILGSGEQARSHLALLPQMREFSQLRLAARNPEQARALAAVFPGCQLYPSFEAAVRGADVVICCTDSPEPVVRLSWLEPGVHLASVGMGAELDEATVRQGRLFVEWRGAVSSLPPAGARELQGMNPEVATELGEVLSGSQPGRLAQDEVTVFKSTGLGVEDAAVARVVYDAARERGLGDWVGW
jgi:ornithine cyclodeaminase/alanine dehydrogenase-like protein (mu-crystallin family)